MIDLHSHLLPGVDDGPRSDDDSVLLASAAAADGVSVMAATPHLRHDYPTVVPAELAARCERLSSRLRAEGIALDVVPGGEVDVHWGQTASDEDLRLVSYGQRGIWLLVETPYPPVTDMFDELVFTLTARGFRTLLAHPERNAAFQQRPERLRALVERGSLLQITAHALVAAERRSPTRRLAEALVRDSLAHVLASDAHHPAGRRNVGLGDAARAADRLVPGAGAYMTEEAPRAILSGREPGSPPSREPGGIATGLRHLLRRRA
jgi:protein-tyrosine phosphatase